MRSAPQLMWINPETTLKCNPSAHTACPHPQAHLEAGHGEEEVWVVLGVDGDEGVVPVKGGEGAGQPVLHIPKDGAAQVDVVLHQAHARIPRPAPAKGGGGAEAGGGGRVKRRGRWDAWQDVTSTGAVHACWLCFPTPSTACPRLPCPALVPRCRALPPCRPCSLLVVVAHNVFVVGVGVLGEVSLDEVLGLLRGEPEQHVHLQAAGAHRGGGGGGRWGDVGEVR